MRFKVDFLNDATDERRSIIAALSAEECRSIDAMRPKAGTEQTDLVARSMAMRAAYSEVPLGFRHTGPPQFVSVH